MTTLKAGSYSYGLAGRFRYKLGAFTYSDLLFEEGKVEDLLGRLRKILGKAKEEVMDLVEKIDRKALPTFFRYEKCAKNSFGFSRIPYTSSESMRDIPPRGRRLPS